MKATITNNKKYHEKMTLEKTTEYLFEYKSKSLPNNFRTPDIWPINN